MHHYEELRQQANRRTFLGQSLAGLGTLACAQLLQREVRADDSQRWNGVVQPLHLPPKCKRVIHLCMAGGPSHLETLDYKPKLTELNGQPMPESVTKGQPIAQLQGQQLKILGCQHEFERYGQSGQLICNQFPKIGAMADELCVVRSVVTEAINHDPAHTFMNTGSTVSGRPAMGAWAWYGLGAMAEDLPGFIVLTSTGASGQQQPIASRQWHSGFLPSRFQGVRFYSKGDAVHYIRNPEGVTAERQKDVVDTIGQLNQLLDQTQADPEIATRINQYEMAFRLQTSVPELMDLSQETQETLDLYGAKQGDGSLGTNCLLARRLAERGVRFIQLYHRDWDHHGGVKNGIAQIAKEVDQPCAALLTDLKRRGMLDETLVIWGGEFGRTPMAQGNGRDHHQKGFSMWLAGGGIKGGISYGNTDEFGYHAVENVFPVHDLHATMLHLLGADHLRLTYRFQGRDYRLTDIAGHVVKEILA